MAQAATNEIKPGMKIELDNDPYIVVSNDFVKPGKGQSFNRIRLKNLKSGRVVEKTYKSGDKLDLANVEETQMRLLYTETEDAVFMNDETFDQIHVPLQRIEPVVSWLKEDTLYDVIFYNGEVIDVMPPTFMELKITQTEPGARGDTASGRVLKPAILESGAKVQVPIFVNEEEVIKVDTRTGEYVSRV
ncbi:MAG TPA: elongation factor P [Chlamydiales bacterium]|nr:elongation factor P [Chlamydiales bacterium]